MLSNVPKLTLLAWRPSGSQWDVLQDDTFKKIWIARHQ
jgi:hypothetical protein